VFNTLFKRLTELNKECSENPLAGRQLGLEKESLRYDIDGVISQQTHPQALGAALTHPYITTDYSEALLEFVTPPFECSTQALEFLSDLHTFVYQRLGDENLWATSMPCVLSGEDSVRIAEYGDSNLGMMKTVYRRGLGHRYGKTMQVISGIHYNYSYPEHFWELLQELDGDTGPVENFIDDSYMAQIRNLQRHGWLLLYLFGASPAVCKSFVGEEPHALKPLDLVTLHEPNGTSLRMGDIGYRNKKDDSQVAKADYNSLDEYVRSLREAINKPQPEYADIGAGMEDPWQQLNANLLQIENEYYSTTRPKQITEGLEKPSTALAKRGIAYVELRSLDVNPYAPDGIDEETILFVECFMLACLLMDSEEIIESERAAINRNFLAVAHNGRDPEQRLDCVDGQQRTVQEAARGLVDACLAVARTLDCQGGDKYIKAVEAQLACVDDPEKTLSGRILADMRANDESFFEFAERMSKQHRASHLERKLSPEREQEWEALSESSIAKQASLEAEPQEPFADFIASYMASR